MSQSKPRGVASLPSVLQIARSADFGIEERTIPDAELTRKFADGTYHERGRRAAAADPSGPPANVLPLIKPRAIAALAATNPNTVVVHDRHVTGHGGLPTRAPEPKMIDLRGAHPAPHARTPARGSARSATRVAAIMPATPASTGWTPPEGVRRQEAAPIAQATPWVQPQPHVPAAAPASPPVQRGPVPAPIHPVVPAPGAWPVAPAAHTPPIAVAPPAAAPHAPAGHPAPYATYEALGLGAPKPSTQRAAKLIVSAYRLLGFSILTIIVVVLVGYITQSAFFYLSSSWAVPMSVTPSDERVVSLQAQLAAQQNTRDRIADELAEAERSIAAQQMFQAEFGRAIKSDLEGRKLALGRIRELAAAAATTRAQIRNANSAYAGASRTRMAEEYAAGLIDRSAMLSGKFQLAQISTSNLTLAERQAEFETRAQELEAQARSLDAILANATTAGDTALSYDVLKIKQEYEASRLDLARSIAQRDTLKTSIARQDKIVASLSQSAYLRALHDHATIVSVPYANLSKVRKGAPLYGCMLGMILCHHVGQVIELLPGEVSFKHPHRDKGLRGQMVEVALDAEDAEAAADDVLFVGGRPVLF
jgi:hypothetical protein